MLFSEGRHGVHRPLQRRAPTPASSRLSQRARLEVEPLEDRQLLSTLLALTLGTNQLLRFDSATPSQTSVATITGLPANVTLDAISSTSRCTRRPSPAAG